MALVLLLGTVTVCTYGHFPVHVLYVLLVLSREPPITCSLISEMIGCDCVSLKEIIHLPTAAFSLANREDSKKIERRMTKKIILQCISDIANLFGKGITVDTLSSDFTV